MQQPKERAAKIVSHLSVQDVTCEGGIKTEMEKSEVPNNQAFGTQGSGPLGAEVQDARPYESVETFINKTPIYRRENDQCQNYKVGSKFYIGDLMDAARRSWLERARP